ncbi:uncharacterized protein (UPF0332 family) [Methanomicrobium sp. W14]|nr:uncharacterized protein (UPF0332 family) [Methanomicrobium sp. W14]
MIFCWSQFLDVAKFLKAQAENGALPLEEAAYRCSISRAYYAAFGYSLTYAKDCMGYIPENTGEEHHLIREFYKSSGKSEIKRKLSRLHQWRKEADYNETVYNLESNMKGSLKEADEIIRSLNH